MTLKEKVFKRIKLTPYEIKEIICGEDDFIQEDESELSYGNNASLVSTIVSNLDKDNMKRYFDITWVRSLDGFDNDEYHNQPREVIPKKKIITMEVTEYKVIQEDNDGDLD